MDKFVKVNFLPSSCIENRCLRKLKKNTLGPLKFIFFMSNLPYYDHVLVRDFIRTQCMSKYFGWHIREPVIPPHTLGSVASLKAKIRSCISDSVIKDMDIAGSCFPQQISQIQDPNQNSTCRNFNSRLIAVMILYTNK